MNQAIQGWLEMNLPFSTTQHIVSKFKYIKKAEEIEALICKEESNESLIDLDTLQDMDIIHKDFPLPLNKNLREDPEKVVRIRENKQNWLTYWKDKVQCGQN